MNCFLWWILCRWNRRTAQSVDFYSLLQRHLPIICLFHSCWFELILSIERSINILTAHCPDLYLQLKSAHILIHVTPIFMISLLYSQSINKNYKCTRISRFPWDNFTSYLVLSIYSILESIVQLNMKPSAQ